MFTAAQLKADLAKYVVKQPPVAHNVEDLLKLLKQEQENAQSPLDDTHSLEECKSNLRQLPDAFVSGINRATMLTLEEIEGIEELCPEMSNYISIFAISCKVISAQLCKTIQTDFISKVTYIYDLLIRLFTHIEKKKKKQLSQITAMLWKEFEEFKKTPLDNQTAVSRKILQDLTVIRDARTELQSTLHDLKIDLKHPLTSSNTNASDASNAAASVDNRDFRYYARLTFDFVSFLNESIHHIYLFLLKYYKSGNDSNSLMYLQKLSKNVNKMPEFVDEICCIVYRHINTVNGNNFLQDEMDIIQNEINAANTSNTTNTATTATPDASDANETESKESIEQLDELKDDLYRYALVLLQIVWNVVSVNAEASSQFKNRRMVLNTVKYDAEQEKNVKVKVAMKGNEWKQKFLSQWNIFCLLYGIDNNVVFNRKKPKPEPMAQEEKENEEGDQNESKQVEKNQTSNAANDSLVATKDNIPECKDNEAY